MRTMTTVTRWVDDESHPDGRRPVEAEVPILYWCACCADDDPAGSGGWVDGMDTEWEDDPDFPADENVMRGAAWRFFPCGHDATDATLAWHDRSDPPFVMMVGWNVEAFHD